jgi:hypothetical protein
MSRHVKGKEGLHSVKGKKLIERGCMCDVSIHGEIYIVGYRFGARGGAFLLRHLER